MARISGMYGGKFASKAGGGTVPLPPDLSPGGRVKFKDRQVGGRSDRNYQAGDIDNFETRPAGWYKVKSGDTLWGIANQFNTPLDSLLSENPQINNPNLILVDQLINLPRNAFPREEPDLSLGGRVKFEDRQVGGEGGQKGFGDTVTVQSGDTLWAIAQRTGTTWQELQELNRIQNPHLIFPGQQILLPGPAWENSRSR
tara:strand:+ start:50 stop:646 length:597 start_codon:yes stop_codon:yes gene_type:complete